MAKQYGWALDYGKLSACSYYRIQVPTSQMNKMDLCDFFIDKGGTRDSNIALTHANFSLWYALAGTQTLHRFESVRKLPASQRQGADIYPPTIIYDHDDNNDFVHPFNASYCAMGTRDTSGRLLDANKDDGFIIENDEGKIVAKYEDGKTHYDNVIFDIERNLHEMKVRHQIIRTAHGVTAASPTLARYFKEVIGAQDTYFFPNTIVPEDYDMIEAVRKDNSVRILWQGGQSHVLDWYPLRHSLKAVCQRYPNVKFVLFGEYFDWVHDAIPDANIEHHKWVDYSAYKLKRGLLNIDINLCPLADNLFNRCKSAIKWYEGTIWERPEATLAANVGPYTEIQDGVTGLLYDEEEDFVQKLSALIENADLRQRLGNAAKEWVLANRTPQATIPGLFDFYSEVRAKHRRAIGKPVIAKPSIQEIKKLGVALR